MCPGEAHDTSQCEQISALLARVGDKWTVLVVGSLGPGPMRFNALRRTVGDISQKMLSTTLRNLERDGFVTRTVTPVNPPQVEYALTDLGFGLLEAGTGVGGMDRRQRRPYRVLPGALMRRGRCRRELTLPSKCPDRLKGSRTGTAAPSSRQNQRGG